MSGSVTGLLIHAAPGSSDAQGQQVKRRGSAAQAAFSSASRFSWIAGAVPMCTVYGCAALSRDELRLAVRVVAADFRRECNLRMTRSGSSPDTVLNVIEVPRSACIACGLIPPLRRHPNDPFENVRNR